MKKKIDWKNYIPHLGLLVQRVKLGGWKREVADVRGKKDQGQEAGRGGVRQKGVAGVHLLEVNVPARDVVGLQLVIQLVQHVPIHAPNEIIETGMPKQTIF